MKRLGILAVVWLFAAITAFSQSSPENSPMAVRTRYILPKRGMEDKFVTAALAHLKKFHADGPTFSRLRRIEFGDKAGWYIVVMGPTAYTTLDHAMPQKAEHDADWSTNVEPFVDQYGPTDLWNFDLDLSSGIDLTKSAKHFEVWNVELKPGQFSRFKDMAGKLKKVYESLGNSAFLVLENDLHRGGGPDLTLLWTFDTYDGWQKDPGPKAAYEKMYGAGTWEKMLADWNDMVKDYSAEIRVPVQ